MFQKRSILWDLITEQCPFDAACCYLPRACSPFLGNSVGDRQGLARRRFVQSTDNSTTKHAPLAVRSISILGYLNFNGLVAGSIAGTRRELQNLAKEARVQFPMYQLSIDSDFEPLVAIWGEEAFVSLLLPHRGLCELFEYGNYWYLSGNQLNIGTTETWVVSVRTIEVSSHILFRKFRAAIEVQPKAVPWPGFVVVFRPKEARNKCPRSSNTFSHD